MKNWHKIFLLIILILGIAFFGLKLVLNSYLRKSLETELNKTFNAEVKISKLNLKFFSGAIEFHDLIIIGKGEFNNDTIIACQSIIVEFEGFNSKTNTLALKSILLDNLKLKNVISESGELCWDNLINTSAIKVSQDELQEQFLIKLRQFVITDAIIEIIDRRNNEMQKLSNLNFVLNLKDVDQEIFANYNFDCIYSSKMFENFKCISSGDIHNINNNYNAHALLELNNFPINIDFSLNSDSVFKTSEIILDLKTDFSKFRSDKAKFKGKSELKLQFLANIVDFNLPKFDFSFIADSIIIVNKTSNDSAFINFQTQTHFNFENFYLNKNISNLNIYTSEQQLIGDFDMELKDTSFCAFSNLNGNINSEKIFEICGWNFDNFNLELSSLADLDYQYSTTNNQENGKFEADFCLKTPFFEINNTKIEFFDKVFDLKSNISNDLYIANSKLEIKDIKNFTQSKQMQINAEINIPKLKLPDFHYKTQELKSKNNLDERFPKLIFSFPEKIKFDLVFKLDSLEFLDKQILNIENYFKMSNTFISLSSNKIFIDNGFLNYEFALQKLNNDTALISHFNVSNLNLSYFTEANGILNLNLDNTIYLGNEKAKTFGENLVSLSGYSSPSEVFKKYKISEDSLKIGDFEAKIILKNDSLQLLPFVMRINDIIARLDGNLDITSENIDVNIFVDTPKEYLSKELKIAIAIFSKKSDKKLVSQKGRVLKHVKIQGNVKKPEFLIYE